MHPFEGTPLCPRCSKSVYAAEQVMGPGRKLYHKPCLACMSCNKRLDSFTLLEHDQQPYCKPCHTRNFGTRDLRQANLPHRTDSSPSRFTGSPVHTPTRLTSPPPILRPNRTLSPTFERSPLRPYTPESEEVVETADSRPTSPVYVGMTTNTGRGLGGLPRTVPLSPTKDRATASPSLGSTKPPPVAFGRSVPLVSTATGTRYGSALGDSKPLVPAPTGTKWGGDVPKCGRCDKSVYFAEQIKAIGKTWHKSCLRCTECNTSLAPSKLTEKDGDPLCHRCYGKLHGPQGSGYALLGKAGG